MLNKKAMVNNKIEKAQGLTLSMIAEIPTSGRSHVPSLLIFHNAFVPILAVLSKSAEPARIMPILINIINFMVKELLWR